MAVDEDDGAVLEASAAHEQVDLGEGVADPTGLTSPSDAGAQHASVALTQRLLGEGSDSSVGTVGDGPERAGQPVRTQLLASDVVAG